MRQSLSPRHRAALSAVMTKKWRDDAEFRAKITQGSTRTNRDPDIIAKRIATLRRNYSDPDKHDELRAKRLAALLRSGAWRCPPEHKAYYDKMMRRSGIPRDIARAEVDKLAQR